MNKQYYELLGLDESATDESVTARYEELKKKYSEDRFLEGEAGNEAARMLNRIDVAYHEIMSDAASAARARIRARVCQSRRTHPRRRSFGGAGRSGRIQRASRRMALSAIGHLL